MAGVTIYNSDYDLWDAWLHKIYETTQQENWFMPVEETVATGVAMRVENGFFRVFPYENPALVPFEAAVRKLNPVVAVKIRNTSVQAAIRKIAPGDNCLYIDSNTRIQILDSIDQLPMAEKDQCGAFIRDERSVVLWSYALENIIPLCKEFEEKLIKHIWRNRDTLGHRQTLSVTSAGVTHPQTPVALLSREGSQDDLNEKSDVDLEDIAVVELGRDKEATEVEKTAEEPKTTKNPTKGSWWSWKLQPRGATSPSSDAEKGRKKKERKLVLIGPIYAGIGAALAAFFASSGVSVLLQEYALDGDFTRFALVVTLPVIYCVSIFFCLQLIGNICLVFGPVAQYHENSMYYSAQKPEPNPDVDQNLPHITIQMPVYKESLELTIAPSVYSVKKAMQTYARQGGTSAIFICDDGMQVLSEEDRNARIAFYANHNIGWTARPGHSSAPGAFKRAGKFKKASNMKLWSTSLSET